MAPRNLSSVLLGLLAFAAFLAPLSEGGFQVALLAASLLAICRFRRRLRIEGRLPRLAALGFSLWLLIGLVTTAFGDAVPRTSSLNYALMGYGAIAGLVLARSDPSDLRRLALAFGAGATVAASVGLCQWLFNTFPGESFLSDGRAWRGQIYVPGTKDRAATGTLQHRLKMSEMWLVALALVVAAFPETRRRRRLALMAVLSLAMLGLTFSKASFGAAILTLAASAVVRCAPSSARKVMAALGATLITGIAVALYLGSATAPKLPAPEGSLEIRPWLWSFAAEFFFSAPLFGHGLGTYHAMAKEAVISGIDTHTWGAHQQLLTIATETGLVGLALFLLSTSVVGLLIVRASYLRPEDPMMNFGFFILVAFGIIALLHDPLFNPGTALIFWMTTGMVLGGAGAGQGRGHSPWLP